MTLPRKKSTAYRQQNLGVPGVVYVLSNPGLRDGVHKVGCSRRSGRIRANELSRSASTGTPGQFICIYEIETLDCGLAEFRLLKMLSQHRVGKPGQEYMELAIEPLTAVIMQVCQEVDAEKSSAPFLSQPVMHTSPTTKSEADGVVGAQFVQPDRPTITAPNLPPSSGSNFDSVVSLSRLGPGRSSFRFWDPLPIKSGFFNLDILCGMALMLLLVWAYVSSHASRDLHSIPVAMVATDETGTVQDDYAGSKPTSVANKGADGVAEPIEKFGSPWPRDHPIDALKLQLDWSRLSLEDRNQIDTVCAKDALRHGLASYRPCLYAQFRVYDHSDRLVQ